MIDKKDNIRERTLEIYSKDYGALAKTFLEFTEPSDIKGTRFLSLEEAEGDDTQYLYLPALGRARRIVSSQKNLRFANTDFTYEDMQRRKPGNDQHTILGEEQYSGFDCYVLESIPKGKNSQYGKRVSWIDKESRLAVKIDFYDKKMRHTKEFRIKKLVQVQGIWTAVETVMADLKARHRTEMRITEIAYDKGMEDDIFSVRRLEQ